MVFAAFILGLFLEYVRPGEYWSWINAMKLGTVVPIAVLILAIITNAGRFSEVLKSRESKFLVLLIILVVISFLHAYNTNAVDSVFKLVLANYFFFISIALLATSIQRIKVIYLTLIIAHVLLIVLNPKIVTDPTIRSYIERHSFLGDGNDFALSLCVLFPMALFLARDAQSRVGKYFSYGLLALVLLAVIGTQSRGAALGIAAILVYLVFKAKQKLVGMAAVLVLVVGVVVVASPQFISRMSTLSNPMADRSAQGRTEFWKSGVRMALAYPLTGVGAGNFPYEFARGFAPHSGWGARNAHSIYFGILGELGFPGLLVLLVMLVGTYKLTEKNQRLLEIRAGPLRDNDSSQRFAMLLTYQNASLIGYMAAGAFLTAQYYPHYFIILGIILATRLTSEYRELIENIGEGQAEDNEAPKA